MAVDGVHTLFVVVGPNGPGTAIGARGIRYLVDRHLTDLGLKADGISCYALRHSSATYARAGRARLDAPAGILGHASVITTGIYARIVDKIAENPARYLEELMGFSRTKRGSISGCHLTSFLSGARISSTSSSNAYRDLGVQKNSRHIRSPCTDCRRLLCIELRLCNKLSH